MMGKPFISHIPNTKSEIAPATEQLWYANDKTRWCIELFLHYYMQTFCRHPSIWPTYSPRRDKPKGRKVNATSLGQLFPKDGCDCLMSPTLAVTARTLLFLSSTSPSTGSTLATKTEFLTVAIKFTSQEHLTKRSEQLILHVTFTLSRFTLYN